MYAHANSNTIGFSVVSIELKMAVVRSELKIEGLNARDSQLMTAKSRRHVHHDEIQRWNARLSAIQAR